MSTITVTNIKATGETASRAVSGVAAAWVNFNGTGTVAIRDSVNVGSITDGGTGIYAVAYSSALDNADYSYQIHGTSSSTGGITKLNYLSGSITTSDIDVTALNAAHTAFQDNDNNSVSIHGDLA